MSESMTGGASLTLTPPAPVQLVAEDEAVGAVPLDEAKQAELRAKARAFAAELATLDVNSPAFSQKVNGIATMGAQDMRASANISNRILERPAAAVGHARGRPGADAQNQVSNTLLDLPLYPNTFQYPP